jgi:hypothetical protein
MTSDTASSDWTATDAVPENVEQSPDEEETQVKSSNISFELRFLKTAKPRDGNEAA